MYLVLLCLSWVVGLGHAEELDWGREIVDIEYSILSANHTANGARSIYPLLAIQLMSQGPGPRE